MNQDEGKQFIAEAVRIGDEILSRAIVDEHGMRWKTMSMDEKRNVEWTEGTGIYSGNSGIALFFMELYNMTGKEEYLDAAKRCLQWVVYFCRKEETEYYSFFTGRMGVAYALMRMGQFLKDDLYLEQALEIVRDSGSFLDGQFNVDDLIGGKAGSALGLAHLHAATGESWLLELLDRFIVHLVKTANPGPSGYYWDRSHSHISGLCGFSHGAAGIGFVFLELGRYLGNDAFYWLAEQAFLYETNFFDLEKKNWLDLRKGIYNDEDLDKHSKAYRNGDFGFFKDAGNMNAWCHGAAGIGLSRLRAWELLHDQRYTREAKLAIERTIMTDVEGDRDIEMSSFILCHGGGGNADLFLEAYRTYGDESYWELATKVGERGLLYRQNFKKYISGYRDAGNNEDTSFFMGNAGIGHFYLRLADPYKVQSVLLPRLTAEPVSAGATSGYCGIRMTLAGMKKILLERYFKRTMMAVEELLPEEAQAYFADAKDIEAVRPEDSFVRFAQKGYSRLKGKRRLLLEDILGLEKKKWQLDLQQESHSLLYIQDEIRIKDAEKLLTLEFEQLKEVKLVVAPDVQIESTRWDWNKNKSDYFPGNLEVEPDDFPILIKPVPMEVAEENLSAFSEAVLMEFQQPAAVGDVYSEVLGAFEELTDEEQELLRQKIVEQVRAALNSGILIKASCVC